MLRHLLQGEGVLLAAFNAWLNLEDRMRARDALAPSSVYKRHIRVAERALAERALASSLELKNTEPQKRGVS
jgi:hypothetical protein